jgi:hypothetical protein
MKGLTFKRRSLLLLAAVAALVAAAFSTVAFAGDREHPHFLPNRFAGAPEVSAVVFNPQMNAFVQLVFDRGRITAVAPGSLTIKQGTGNHVWRTQTFTIPSTAEVVVDGRHIALLTRLRIGMHVRIEQSGPVGGTLAVVRVDATRGDRDINFPPDDD